MSLLLDALKKAAQEKLEKQGGQADPGTVDENHVPAPEREHEATAAEPDVSTPPDNNEEALELEPLEDMELSIDTDAFTEASDTDYRYRRSQVLASELRAFNNNSEFDKQITHGRGDDTAANERNNHSDWGIEPINSTDWNSPIQAAKVFSSKSPDRGKRLFFIAGIPVGILLLGGSVFAYHYFTRTGDDFLVVMSRPEPVEAVAATDSTVDPTLLIEQEDYSNLLANESTAPTARPAAADTTVEQLSNGNDARRAAPVSKPVEAADKAPVRRQAGFDEGEFKIRRTNVKEPLQNILMRGYTAYNKGEFENAEIVYRQALTRAPENRDALLGMAAVRYAQGDFVTAADHYRTLLQRDPKDELALAALAGIEDTTQRAFPKADLTEESRIKLLMAEKPDSGYLHFTLGNIYAAESRWAEAQQAYFDAYRLEPENPDYVFNLAVSLDHLGKKKEAVLYYRQSLTLASDRKANFDTHTAVNRLDNLQEF